MASCTRCSAQFSGMNIQLWRMLIWCMHRQKFDIALHPPQEDYIKEEQRNLKRELLRAQEEVKRIQVHLSAPP